MPIEGRLVIEDRDLGLELEFEECVLEAVDGAADTLRESAGEGGAGRLEKSAVSTVMEVGLLWVGVVFEFEEMLLGMEAGRGLEYEVESIDDTRVDGSGMKILVPS